MYGRHEAATEAFYETGVDNYESFWHGSYLNFGYYAGGETDFVKAAEALVGRVAEKIGLGPDSELLDVACGMGTQDQFLARRFRPARIQAVDLTAKHVSMATRRNAHPGVVSYSRANACSLPFPDSSFTHVMGIEGPAHFDTRERFFREAYRVLKPGGGIGTSDFVLAREPRGPVERAIVRAAARFWHIPMENADTPDRYKRKLERSGFECPEVEVVSDDVFPGYWSEQWRARKEMYDIRGPFWGRISLALDWLTTWLYRRGIAGYVFVSARKPA